MLETIIRKMLEEADVDNDFFRGYREALVELVSYIEMEKLKASEWSGDDFHDEIVKDRGDLDRGY
jgi:hypothetical protein